MRETPSGEGKSRRGSRRVGRATLGMGLGLSVAAHAVVLTLLAFPLPRSAETDAGWTFRQVDLPPRVEVPAPPEPVDRPPPPSVERVEVDVPTVAAVPPEPPTPGSGPPEPPQVSAVTPSEAPGAVPRHVPPLLETSDRFRNRLRKSYQRMLAGRHRLGVGGTVRVRFFVDPRGEVSQVRIAASSGHRRLDRLARRLVEETKFHPALSRDRKVGVWVSQPICFVPTKRGSGASAEDECDAGVALGGG